MHLEYLDSFLAVAKEQSFSVAAERLYISQSSLTKRIQNLETRLGHKLFDRSIKAVTLTNFGKLYFKYAVQISELEAAFENDALIHGLRQQALTFGTIPSSAAYKIADLISSFIKQTDTNCKITSNTSGTLEALLDEGKCDFAFIKNVEPGHDFKTIPFNDDRLVAVLPKQHPLAKQKELRIEDLKKESFLLQPAGSRPYQLCINLFKHAGFNPPIISTDGQIENLVDFVGQGIGVSLLMGKIVTHNTNVVVVPIVPRVTATISLCYRDFTPTHLQARFLNFFKANKAKFANVDQAYMDLK